MFGDMHDGEQIMTDKFLSISPFWQDCLPENSSEELHDKFGNIALKEISLNYQRRLYWLCSYSEVNFRSLWNIYDKAFLWK